MIDDDETEAALAKDDTMLPLLTEAETARDTDTSSVPFCR